MWNNDNKDNKILSMFFVVSNFDGEVFCLQVFSIHNCLATNQACNSMSMAVHVMY